MTNIQIIKTNIDVSKILKQLEIHTSDWNSQTKMKNSDSVLNYGFPPMDVGVLQLVIGVVRDAEQYVGDSEISMKTPNYTHHTAIGTWLRKNGFKNHDRCGFLLLPVDGKVGTHIDEGKYYLTRDRYHLSIYGKYRYTVGDEFTDVEAGTLLKFNNKLPHSAVNIGDCNRITFVFDVPINK